MLQPHEFMASRSVAERMRERDHAGELGRTSSVLRHHRRRDVEYAGAALCVSVVVAGSSCKTEPLPPALVVGCA